MGLFDIFKGKSEAKPKAKPKARDKDIARMAKLVSTKMSQNYDRQEALDELGRIQTSKSAAVLLKRFDWTMEPSITDQDEKETAMRGLIDTAEEALEPIREHCKKAESLTWPLRTLRGIVSEESYVEELLGILDLFDSEYVRNPEPKIQLITLLEEHPSTDVRIAVEPFVQDASEPVRFAAVTTVFKMEDEESIPSLIDAIVEEESLRVRNRIAQGFVDRSWEVPEELSESFQEALPPDYSLNGATVVRDM